MHEATTKVLAHEAELRDEALAGDQQAKITQKTHDIVAASGGMKLMLAKDLGGYEAHPLEFAEWAMSIGINQPSAGWIAGVVGIHPWEISIMDERLQREIYVDSPHGADTWTSSPYAPFGRAKKVDGGFILNGRWPFGTGTDYCEWAILGGHVVGEDGNVLNPPEVRHFVLPKGDYTPVPDSWNVSGLQGTGSKDILVQDAFVPDYRVVEGSKMGDGSYGKQRRPGSPLYQMLFGVMFPAAIAAGTFAIARGAVRAYADYIGTRVSVSGTVSKTDPFQLHALAKAESDVEAGISHYKDLVSGLYDHVSKGGEVSMEQRLLFNLHQRRGTTRAIEAVEELVRLSGTAAIQTGSPLDRYVRDLRVAGTHICNITEPHFSDYSLYRLTGQTPPAGRY